MSDLCSCQNPLCERRVGGALYCCAACASAHEGRYEIHESGPLGHSPSCDKRHAFRKAYEGCRNTDSADRSPTGEDNEEGTTDG